MPLPIRMRKAWLISLLLAVGCGSKQRPVATAPVPTPVIRSQTPPPNAELIEHCVVTKEENTNTVSCRCLPLTTKIDSKTGQIVVVCKKMPEIAVTVGGQNTDIWVYDISRGTLTRVTFDGTAAAPVWSPDGKRIAYASFKNGQFVILWKPADGSGMEEVLVSPQSSMQVPLSFTPDGKFLAYMFSNPNARIQVNLAPLHGERTPKPFVTSQFDDNGGLFSPDGRWLAYFSNESGQFEVYVQPFPGPGGRWQISASGGYGPVWARSGRELFYTDGNQIFSAGVTSQLRLVSSTPRPVVPFTPGVIGLFSYNRIFDVAPDGQRFLVVEKNGGSTAPEELRLVEGWLDELARRQPRTQMNEP